MFKITRTGLSRAHGNGNPGPGTVGPLGMRVKTGSVPPSQQALYFLVGAKAVRNLKEVDG